MAQRASIALVLACLSLLVVAPGAPAAKRHLPTELWKAYPLQPAPAKARARTAARPSRPRVPYRRIDARPPVRGVETVGRRPSGVGTVWWERLPFAVMLLLVVGAIGVLVVTRSPRPAGRRIPDVLAHVGSAVATPLRSADAFARPRRSRGARDALHAASRVGHGLLAAAGWAVRWAIWKRRPIMLYGFSVVASAALGAAVVLLLGR